MSENDDDFYGEDHIFSDEPARDEDGTDKLVLLTNIIKIPDEYKLHPLAAEFLEHASSVLMSNRRCGNKKEFSVIMRVFQDLNNLKPSYEREGLQILWNDLAEQYTNDRIYNYKTDQRGHTSLSLFDI